MAVAPNLWITINLYNICLPVIKWNKNILWNKLHQSYTHLGKIFLELLLLKVCEMFFFRHSKKVYSIVCLYEPTLHFSRRPNRYSKSIYSQSIKAVQQCLDCFLYCPFCWLWPGIYPQHTSEKNWMSLIRYIRNAPHFHSRCKTKSYS